MQKLEAGLTLGEKAFNETRGNSASFYTEKLALVREHTKLELMEKDDSWMDEVTPLSPNHMANNYFRWFHVFEDELNHRGQIRLIQSHMNRNKQ
ncbi:hypothetical protein [Bacillus sp. LL01]|uniref:hypothetical protein n=1 Tax=Bacillus sp. LL01 TaxID=1665556 RepID=UPI00069D2BFD|nr:hypothetical protein [Bacillus sp. LL01]